MIIVFTGWSVAKERYKTVLICGLALLALFAFQPLKVTQNNDSIRMREMQESAVIPERVEGETESFEDRMQKRHEALKNESEKHFERSFK